MRARSGIKIDCLCLTRCNNPGGPPLLRIQSRGTLLVAWLLLVALLRLPAMALQAAPALVLSFVEYFLLFGREHRANLRHRVVHQHFNFLHRISANGLYLRIRLVNDRLDLRFLFRREI